MGGRELLPGERKSVDTVNGRLIAYSEARGCEKTCKPKEDAFSGSQVKQGVVGTSCAKQVGSHL